MSKMTRLLTNKNLLILYLSGFLIMINLFITLTIFPLYINLRGGTDFTIGLHNSVFAISSVILRLYFGPLADSAGRRVPLVIGAFVFTTAPLLVWISPNLEIMLLARVYQAIGMGTLLSAISSSVADITEPSLRGTALGFYRAIVSVAIMTGPFFAFRLINRYGYPGLFIGISLTSLIAMILFIILPLPDLREESAVKRIALSDILALFSSRDLIVSYIAIIFISIAQGNLLSYTAIYVGSIDAVITVSRFFSLFAIAGIAAAPLSGHASDRFGRFPVIIPSLILFSAGLLMMGIPQLFSGQSAFLFPVLIGFGYTSTLTVTISWIVDKAPERLRGTALSFQESSIDFGIGIGTLIFGLLSSTFLYSDLFKGLSLLVLTTLLIFFIMKKQKQ